MSGLRYESDRGTFDPRDYRRDSPLALENLAAKWLQKKKKTHKRHFSTLKRTIDSAIKAWGNVNIKLISYADIEDFLFEREDISEKTRANMKSALFDFFKWVQKREKRNKGPRYEMPEFPDVPFKLGWRNITDIETQQKILKALYDISWDINPKIYIAVKFLATYINIRPGELTSRREKHIDLKLGAIIVEPKDAKEGEPKFAFLDDDDIELLKSIPRGLPDLYFFRHGSGRSGVKPGQKFGDRYLYKYWKKACKLVGVEGVDLYGGTRHTTTTAMGEFFSPEEIQGATGHASKAFRRYFQSKQRRAKVVTAKIKKLQKTNQHLINISDVSKPRN